MRFTKKNLIAGLEQKFDAITKRPEMWGVSLEAVELQALMILEDLSFAKNGTAIAGRDVLNKHIEFCREKGAANRFLNNLPGMDHRKLADLMIEFRGYANL